METRQLLAYGILAAIPVGGVLAVFVARRRAKLQRRRELNHKLDLFGD